MMGKKILLTIMLGLMVLSFSTAVLAQEDKEERPTATSPGHSIQSMCGEAMN